MGSFAMIRSMTGFGEVQREAPDGVIGVQIRTVNHRHFHTHFRLPVGAERYESNIAQIIREQISRGSVHFRLTYQRGAAEEVTVPVDHERVRAYLAALQEIQARHGIEGRVDLSLFARLSDIFSPPPEEIEHLPLEEVALATREALTLVVAVREEEGKALAADLLGLLGEIGAALQAIELRAPQRLIEERDRLRVAVAELTQDVELDEERLAREVAFLAERWDIHEETVRLRSHLEQFAQLIEAGEAAPVGKRLAFWVQEMHREANTIGSKGNDSEVAKRVVDIKTAIERLREQVENVE